jgi:hypothetical protein
MPEQNSGTTRIRLTSVEGDILNVTVDSKKEEVEFWIDPNAGDRFTVTGADINLFASLLKVK